MKILLFGKNGQIGTELSETLNTLGEVIALGRSSDLCGDLTSLEGIANTIRSTRPNIIVNAAAFTAVDAAENEQQLSKLINCEAPAIMAREALAIDAILVHYSTDYVFDGIGKAPWLEKNIPNPLNYYGKSKLLGEIAIENSGCKFLLIRTSWIYGRVGKNFVKSIIKLALNEEVLRVIDDQLGAPTSARFIAEATTKILRSNNLLEKLGLYHLASDGETSWYNFAKFIIHEAKRIGLSLRIKEIVPVKSSEYKTQARRPLYSKLNCSKIENRFSITRPNWQDDFLQQLKLYQRNLLEA